MNVKNLLAILIVASLVFMPLQASEEHHAKWDTKTGTIEADGIVVRFFQFTPHYLIWIPEANITYVYHIQFMGIYEFVDSDNDSVIDYGEVVAKTELTAMDQWSVTAENTTIDGVPALVVKFEANVTVFEVGQMGKMGGEIGKAYVAFVNKIFLENYTTEDGYEIAGGKELKIDIVIDNWPWVNENSKLGLEILFAIGDCEGKEQKNPHTYMHEVKVQNRAVKELRLNDTDIDYPLAFRWEEQIRVKLGDNETKTNITSSLDCTADKTILTLVYPHTNGTIIHDPSIVPLTTTAEETPTEGGVETPETTVLGLPLSTVVLVGIVAVVAIAAVILIKKK